MPSAPTSPWKCHRQRSSDCGHLPHVGPTLSLPSLADPHHGRVTQRSDPQIRGMAAAMPQRAFVQVAGSTRRHTGKLPKQQCSQLRGICLPTATGIYNYAQGLCQALPALTLCPHHLLAPTDPGNCGSAAPALLRASTDSAPLWGTAPAPGSAAPVLPPTLVGNKAFSTMQSTQGPRWAWHQGPQHTAWLQEGPGYHSGLSCLQPGDCP